MKNKVTDSAVAEYAAKIRAGGPLGKVFPGPMSDCDFTDDQRRVIRQARIDKRASLKNAKVKPASAVESKRPTVVPSFGTATAPVPRPKGRSKLSRILYLQLGRCFFCGEPLKEEEASIEHLNPKSRGGTNDEDNEVVCHASLNETFGAMDLKRKFAFVLSSAGSFKCPK